MSRPMVGLNPRFHCTGVPAMTSTCNDPESPASQSRREALKKFGRYAAAAPTLMVLLEPRESHAGMRNGRMRGRNWGGWGKGKGDSSPYG